MKPTVHYHKHTLDEFPRVGEFAFLQPADHPSELVSNTKIAKTSRVVQCNWTRGEFETENTIYVPL